MKHYGDITKINGAEVEPVWVVIGGSPCQDLSVAGRRAGLQGERSGLFMEQIRIIKEMREADERRGRTDEHIRPRYMVWENVPGALSSNGGEDFRVVLEETARVKDKTAVIPRPPKGKWSTSGCIVGDGYSIAWRIRDAQFWGVPQRRRRIALIADFGGQSAPEILFEREGSARYFEQSYEAWKEITRNSASGVGEASANVIYGISSYDSNAMKSPNPDSGVYETDASRTLDNNGGNPGCNQSGMAVVYNGEAITSRCNASKPTEGDPCHTLGATGAGRSLLINRSSRERERESIARCSRDDNQRDTQTIGQHTGQLYCGDFYNQAISKDVSKTLTSMQSDSDHIPILIYEKDNLT